MLFCNSFFLVAECRSVRTLHVLPPSVWVFRLIDYSEIKIEQNKKLTQAFF